ncbi:MAG: pentapeptide repeat-containing protein [Candidatus Micrarchaeota archaeon]|nr:pentapeptide repeat-containing protein [Candidatus Micrarchaeota archaeon]
MVDVAGDARIIHFKIEGKSVSILDCGKPRRSDVIALIEEAKKKNLVVNLVGATLSKIDLSGLNFARGDISNADLSGSNLSKSNFFNANLSHANLSNANLSGADFSFANMAGADRKGADLSDANLFKTNM